MYARYDYELKCIYCLSSAKTYLHLKYKYEYKNKKVVWNFSKERLKRRKCLRIKCGEKRGMGLCYPSSVGEGKKSQFYKVEVDF